MATLRFDMTKTESLQWTVAFRTSAFHAELLNTVAAETGVTRSHWLRELVERGLEEELSRQLRRHQLEDQPRQHE